MRSALWNDSPVARHELEIDEIIASATEAVFFAVRPEEAVCGFVETAIHSRANVCERHPVGYIEGWYVDPDVQRQGGGRALVATAEV